MITDENEAYHADKSRIGKSGLDLIDKSPAHYYAEYLDPNRVRKPPTDALAFGSALHTLVFEPEDFAKRFVLMPEINRRTNEGKAQYAAFIEANQGKTIIDDEVLMHCKKMKEVIFSNPTAAVLLEKGIAEQRVNWEWNGEDETGNQIHVPCKIKPDWHSHNDFLVDLKTTEDASPEGFGKSVFNFRYHVQAAFYSDGLAQSRAGEYPRGFIFIAIEKRAPYHMALYYITPEQIGLGRREYERNLRTYHKCLHANEWPGYNAGELMAIQLPAWAYRK